MKALFASADAGLLGLAFFVIVFAGIFIWVYNPRNKDAIEALKFIPLNEEDHD